MSEVQKKGGLRVKVLLGFSIALIILGIAAVINFTSLSTLNSAIKTISSPDPKLIVLKELLTGLSDEESSVRTFTLTHNEKYLAAYENASDSVHSHINRLRMLNYNDKLQESITDSIERLVGEREDLFNQFIEKRKTQLTAQVPANSIINAHISEVRREDSLQRGAVAMENKVDSIKEEKNNKGFFNKIKGWFNPSDKKNNDDEELAQAHLDSARNSASVTPTNNDLKQALAKQQNELNKQVRVWSMDELLWLQQDKMVMDKIRSAITILENAEERIAGQQADEANKVANKSTLIIVAIGMLGIVSTLIFIYLIMTDISRSNRLKLQLIEERGRAEKLAKVKEEFLANMSHEIRTPLNSIIGFTEQLSKQNLDEKQQRFTNAIQHSSDHLVSLVNQVLDFSKMESGKYKLHEESFDFPEMIREVYETFRIKASEKNILLAYKIEENVPRFLKGDVMGVKQILINLAGNGIKFTDSGSVEINCRLKEENDEVVKILMEVKDTGAGIPADMKEKIFEKFTQAENEMTRKYGGAGLGLAISKKLVESMDGTISVESEPGRGATFSVMIPFKKSEQSEAKEQEETPVLYTSIFRNRRALLVDDEEMNVMLNQVILTKWGMKIESAANGMEALEKVRNNNYDLLLLDIQMPGMSGIEVANEIRSMAEDSKKNVPIIALTANVFNDQNKTASGSPFNDILIKPFKEKDLFEKIKNVLRLTSIESSKPFIEVSNGNEELGDDQLFSLKYLEKTSGANSEFEIRMLRSFIQNNTGHLARLKEALNEKDWDTIHRLAHKMIPQFRYLQIRRTEEKLKLVEQLTEQKKHLEKIPALVTEISSVTEEVLESLDDEIQKLERGNGPVIMTP